jgi:branched-chain amino acid transport system permease protein
MLKELLEVLISGLTNGSVYAVMAVGMALVYGVTKVFNFAYGSFFSLGGYLAWLFFAIHFNYFFALIAVIPLLFLSGVVTERFIIRPLRSYEDWEMLAVMVTLGLALFLDNLYLVIFGPFVKSLPVLFEGNLKIAGIVISIQDLSIFFIAIAIMVAFMLFLGKTRQGLAVRAVAQDMMGAQIVGIAKDRVFSYTFAISSILVGTSGILLAPKYFVSPLGGWSIMVKAWVITALGGMGSIKGSMFAAFILGVVEAVVAWKFGFTWTMVAWFAVLLTTLVIKPQGLFGKAG